MTHADLIKVAAKWLRGSVGCSVVADEIVSFAGQTPDAIGFKSQDSFLIEVKVSRSDFRADKKKQHQRTPEKSMGNYRWYMTPPGLLKVEDLPEGWGLLEPQGDKVKIIRGSMKRGRLTCDRENGGFKKVGEPRAGTAHRFDKINTSSERLLLFSIARRLTEQASVNCSEGGEP